MKFKKTEPPPTSRKNAQFFLSHQITFPPIQVVAGSWNTVSKSASWTDTDRMISFWASSGDMLFKFSGSVFAAKWPRTYK